jgi:hypothetical protein
MKPERARRGVVDEPPIFAAARARAIGSCQLAPGESVLTGLTRSRVASRSASSSPKNSVIATMTPVIAAKRRNAAARNAIYWCHLRQNAGFMMCAWILAKLALVRPLVVEPVTPGWK